MEKKEARIKCSGCGTSYKLKLPVTEKPVSFKCKKCGKVLKIRLKLDEVDKGHNDVPVIERGEFGGSFETTQLPDTDTYQNTPADNVPDPMIEGHSFTRAEPSDYSSISRNSPQRRWLVLAGDIVKGPFSDDEIILMIRRREIQASTSLRMGERPWIKAGEIAGFRELFGSSPSDPPPSHSPKTTAPETLGPVTFQSRIWKSLGFPFRNIKAFASFAAIAFVGFAAISFDFLIGLLPLWVLWVPLFGYLILLCKESAANTEEVPPDFKFPELGKLFQSGLPVSLFVLLYSVLPVSILLILMIAAFLNDYVLLGWLAVFAVCLIFLVSMSVVPAGIYLLERTNNLLIALDPTKLVHVMKTGGKTYRDLLPVAIAAGVVIIVAVLASVFLVEVPFVGFVLAGLLPAATLTYLDFILFHAVGMFVHQNPSLPIPAKKKKK